MKSPGLRVLLVLLLVLPGVVTAQQPNSQRTSSGGLTVLVPSGYVSAELGPGAIGMTANGSASVILIETVSPAAGVDQIVSRALSRIGAQSSGDELAIEAGSPVIRAQSYMRGDQLGALYVVEANAVLVLIRVEPLTPSAAHAVQQLAGGIVYRPPEAAAARTRCGSETLPRVLSTAGGLTACFGAAFSAEAKGPNSIGLSDLEDGIIISIYAQDDLAVLLGAEPADVESAAAAFAQSLEAVGARVLSGSTGGSGALSLPVSYPGVGAGRLIVRDVDGEPVVLSALLLGIPPADVASRLDAIASSITITTPAASPGTVRQAPTVLTAGEITFTAAAGWIVDIVRDDVVQLTREDNRALLRVTSAQIGPNWNVDAYVAGILTGAAQFAGDVEFSRESLVERPASAADRRLEYYNSAQAVSDANTALQTGFLTLEPDVLSVFQALISDPTASAIVYSDVLAMMASVERR